AHSVTGGLVKYCIDNKKTLTELSIKEFKKFSKLIADDIYKYISVKASIEGKKSPGGTSRKMVRARIKKIKTR
ncbi:MAG: argininosuccinate lyase, partial [Thermodesulfovibrionia bacterium]|nr:argininosuccinate lyase [Thermodesulfovibrionia bacterium]